MRRRRILVVSVVTSLAVAWIACSSYGEDTLLAPDGGSADAEVDVAPDGILDDGSVTFDVEPIGDGGVKIDASTCLALDCDCDKDGFHKLQSGCDASIDQKNVDCDDTDTRYRPNQLFLDLPPEPPRNGDWNCSGSVDKLFEGNVNCAGLLLGACGKQGFRGSPDCGAIDTYVFCAPNGPSCKEGTTEMRKQACR